MDVNETRLQEVKRALTDKRLVIVLGAGVTAATSDLQSASSWLRLIESGADFIKSRRVDLPATFAPMVDLNLSDPSYAPGLIAAADLVTHEMGGVSGANYREWLAQYVGAATVDRPQLLDAIVGLGAPIATVNYDTLLEKHTGRVGRTWMNPTEMQAAVSGLTQDIAHLHGIWHEPKSIVFGGLSYGRLIGDGAATVLENSLGTVKSLLFVGCGDGLVDPNFSALTAWLAETFPETSVRHYRLARSGDGTPDISNNGTIFRLEYGSEYDHLPGFLARLEGTSAPLLSAADTVQKTRADIVDRLRTESVFVDQMPDIQVRSIDQLIVPPILLPVTHEQFVAAQRDEDGPKINRVEILDDLRAHSATIIVGDESAGLTTTLQWLVAQAQVLDPTCATVVVDYRRLTGAQPLDRGIRLAIRSTGASIGSRDAMPAMALAIDNVAPADRGLFPRLLAELPIDSAKWLIVGCRPGSEAVLDARLRSVGIKPVIRYIGRMGAADIRHVAELVAPRQAERLARRAVTIIKREHLARTPLTVCLLVSVLIAGESLLSTSSETALLDAYVSLLLGRGSANDDARFVLDAHENSSLLSALAETYVHQEAGALDESMALKTFEDYFALVGWDESASEALDTLIRRHVLVRRAGRIEFAQASLLHLFAAKRAVSNPDLKTLLLRKPIFYAEVIKHCAALTRNDRELVVEAKAMVETMTRLGAGVPRSAQLLPETVEVITDPAELDEALTRLGGPLFDAAGDDADGTRRAPKENPQDELLGEDVEQWVPFPLTPIEDLPPIAQLTRTLTLTSNILRDSEEVQDLDLKRDTLRALLRLWGVAVDIFEADPEFIELMTTLAADVGASTSATPKQIDRIIAYLTEMGPLLSVMTGMTATLSSRKLVLTLKRVFADEDLPEDAGVLIMGALLAYDIHERGWTELFETVRQAVPDLRAIDSALYPLANNAYFDGVETKTDADRLEAFLADHASLRAGRLGTREQSDARGRVLQSLRRNKLAKDLKKSIGEGSRANEGDDNSLDP